ncbi:MAG: 6-hydroxymethylpterin diphosphokinase MptE-like protein [Pseudomonadota bacterium]
MSKNKRLASRQPDTSEQFLQRMQKNLAYFQKHHPGVHKLLAALDLKNVELVVTPGRDDVDMVAFGKSCYRGLAREYSLDEAAGVLKDNPESKLIRTFAPPAADRYRKKNFVNKLLQEVVLSSPVMKRPFAGYIRGNFFPSMVFLGAGLGYHIDWLSRTTQIVNGIVIEREPEKFAVSLYTTDWSSICSRFAKRGRSLSFAIGKADSLQEIRALVSRSMTQDVPFYPFFSTYYNHLADVEIARGVLETAKDLSVVSANWIDYDNEMVRLKNSLHNFSKDGQFIARAPDRELEKPVVVVGSGPSIDKRIDDLKAIRDKVTVISAGTGLRALLAADVIPDFQMELDPGNLVYRFHSETDRELLKKVTLLAVNEVNPKVPELFKEVIYFLKFDNALPHLLGCESKAFNGCHPTVTNAALSIGYSLGAKEVYLFGTDYGFESEDRDHADHSIYGKKSGAEITQKLRPGSGKKAAQKKVFETESVTGGTILTRFDYFVAKRSVEDLVFGLTSDGRSFSVYNCADGARIEGVEWLSSSQLLERFETIAVNEDKLALDRELLGTLLEEIPAGCLAYRMPAVARELARVSEFFERLVRSARLEGRKDLCLLVNEIRQYFAEIRPVGGKTVSREFVYVHQLLSGSVKHFLFVGLCHGMACEDSEIKVFLKKWRANFQAFWQEIPEHFKRVVLSDLPPDQDPWSNRTLFNADPEFEGMMPLEVLKAEKG